MDKQTCEQTPRAALASAHANEERATVQIDRSSLKVMTQEDIDRMAHAEELK